MAGRGPGLDQGIQEPARIPPQDHRADETGSAVRGAQRGDDAQLGRSAGIHAQAGEGGDAIPNGFLQGATALGDENGVLVGQGEKTAAGGIHQPDIVIGVMGSEGLETLPKFRLLVRIGGDDPFGGQPPEKRRLHDQGRVRQALGSPIHDLGDLELGDGPKILFGFLPQGAPLIAVEKNSSGEQGQHGQRRDDGQLARERGHGNFLSAWKRREERIVHRETSRPTGCPRRPISCHLANMVTRTRGTLIISWRSTTPPTASTLPPWKPGARIRGRGGRR